jgi:hypothetical protein
LGVGPGGVGGGIEGGTTVVGGNVVVGGIVVVGGGIVVVGGGIVVVGGGIVVVGGGMVVGGIVVRGMVVLGGTTAAVIVPTPVAAADCGLSAALSANRTAALRVPLWLGANATWTEHVLPGVRLAPVQVSAEST